MLPRSALLAAGIVHMATDTAKQCIRGYTKNDASAVPLSLHLQETGPRQMTQRARKRSPEPLASFVASATQIKNSSAGRRHYIEWLSGAAVDCDLYTQEADVVAD